LFGIPQVEILMGGQVEESFPTVFAGEIFLAEQQRTGGAVLQAAVSFFRGVDDEEVARKRKLPKKLSLCGAEGFEAVQEGLHVVRALAPPDDFVGGILHEEAKGLGVGAHFHGGVDEGVKVGRDIIFVQEGEGASAEPPGGAVEVEVVGEGASFLGEEEHGGAVEEAVAVVQVVGAYA